MAAAAMKKRAKGGMVNLNDDPDGERAPGKINTVSGKKTVLALGKKTSSGGFANGGATVGKKAGGAVPARKEGGAISGAASTPSLAKRARGGAAKAPFSSAGSTQDREGSGKSGHEGE
jgi:hypothetical protein